uniref:RING-type domain-containing protein n=1 Tax=Branchiostoma floridae TaxID=7739 RepID=C3YHG9_BRAFL|eukprot:XP_002603945.1 hypothetical protein BRAFLDRAFT_102373 [Branchiostoma floridae]
MAAAPSSLGTQIREELTCSICLELFTRPKVLPCQHTFCLSPCLENLAGRGGTLKCAVCRQQVRLPRQGVASLPDNLMAANMCEKLQNVTTLSGETREQPQSGNRCSFHPTEEVKLYCKQCKMPVCSECCEEGHDGHPTTGLRKAAQERRCMVQANINEGRGRGHHHGNQCHQQHRTFGEKGSGIGQFNGPLGVTVSDEGEIFVADTLNQRIQVFTLQGTFVRQFPTAISGEWKVYPEDVAMDGEGNLWVLLLGGIYTDAGFAQIAVQYDKQGRVLRKFKPKQTEHARGVAVDTRRNHILIIQVYDDRHDEVLVYQPDGTRVRTVGKQQEMRCSTSITVDGEGNILVSDCSNDCVFVYKKNGQFLFKFGNRAGNIIVADSNNSRVEMFDKTGKFFKHVATLSDMGKPTAVAMATQGQLVVTDVEKNTVSIFSDY